MSLSFRAFIIDSGSKAIELENYDGYLQECTLEGIDENRMSLFGCNDMLIMTKTSLENRIIGNKWSTSDICAIDLDETNMTVFHKGRDEILFFRNQEIYNDRLFDGVLQTIYDGNFIIAVKNNLVWIAEGTEMASHILELPKVEEIKYSKREGNELLVMARGADNEFVYRISLDSKEIKDVFPMKEEQQVLSAYEGKLYTVSKDALHIYEEGKEGYRETDCKMWKSKLKDTNKLEMAGNVVFVYDVGRDGNRFILKEMQVLDK